MSKMTTITALLVLTMLITLFAGCAKTGGSEKEATASTGKQTDQAVTSSDDQTSRYGDTGGLKLPITDKPVKITWMLVGEEDPNERSAIRELEERTGVDLEIQAVGTAGHQEKVKITLASGKLPDIFHGAKNTELISMGTQGAFVAINKYVDILPNFKSLYIDNDENNWVMKSWSDDKGDIYTWPIYYLHRDINHGFMYRKDIFDKLGIPLWTNTDEFYQALKQIKEAYPESFPLASKMQQWIFRDYGWGWGVTSYEYPMYYDKLTKLWKFNAVQPEYKAMLDYLKKLYNEKLLDPEFLTDTSASWTAKMTSENKAFVTFDWIGRLDMFYNQIKEQNPEYNLRFGNPVGPKNVYKVTSRIDNFGLAVANNPNYEVALKLLDYLSSPSGSTLITVGVEGKDFVWENDKPVYPSLKDAAKVDISLLIKEFGCWLEAMYVRPDRRSVYYNFTEKEQEAQDMSKGRLAAINPFLRFRDEETGTISELNGILLKAAEEFSSKYIMDESYGSKEWDEWLNRAEKLGYKRYEDVYKNAQSRY